MKNITRLITTCLLFVLVLSACAVTTSPTPTSSVLPPLPTPEVPPPSAFEDALNRWKNSGNQSYYLEVTEQSKDKNIMIRLVIKDEQVRAAQILEFGPEGWSDPSPLSFEEAQKYTIEGLFARLQSEAAGDGPAPLKMNIVFDQSMGAPLLVNAEGMPSYTNKGTVKLNNEYSYTLVSEIKALIEETTNPGKTPVFTLTRSNGPDAWCDSLYVYVDRNSQYSDDCRQTTLGLQVPENIMQEVIDLSAQFDYLDTKIETNNSVKHLQIQGTGSIAPDQQTIQAAWQLADRLNELLSYPLGAGVMLMYIKDNTLLGMDMQQQIVQPARIDHSGEIHGASIGLDSNSLAFADERGLRVLDIAKGESISLLAQPEDGSIYVPRSWNVNNELLISLIPNTDQGMYEFSTMSLDTKEKHDLPLPDGVDSYGCDTGADWSPDGSQLVIAGQNYGPACNINSGLTVIDFENNLATNLITKTVEDGTSEETLAFGAHNPRWSPNGEWIAFSLDENEAAGMSFPSRMYVIHPDGRGLAPISTNVRGHADYPVWTRSGTLYYSLQGANTEANGIYEYDLSTGEASLLLPGENLRLDSISPDGDFLAFFDNNELYIYVFLTEQILPETIPSSGDIPVDIVGWFAPPEQ